MKKKILVTGWRFLPHSYAVVNQFLCLELARRPDVSLYFEDVPFYSQSWQRTDGLFPMDDELTLQKLEPLPSDVVPDAELRIAFPFNFSQEPRAARTAVFGTAEFRVVLPNYISEQVPLKQAHALHDGKIEIVTCSNWAYDGFIASGADAERTSVVPLGFEPKLFHPPSATERSNARASRQIADDEFVFLTVGSMTGNKQPVMLLKAFASVVRQNPRAKLMLKGADDLYGSYELFKAALASLIGPDMAAVFPRVQYVGKSLSFAEMAELYHSADCYVTPYSAEGFNLPALESAACGLPVICTAGGSTDDFTTELFAMRINSSEVVTEHNGVAMASLLPDAEHLAQLMMRVVDDHDFCKQAFVEGPKHAHANFTWKNSVDKLLGILFP